MKLSEAIRAGAKIRPQGYGALYSTALRWFGLLGTEKRSCALGAAFEAGECEVREGVSRGGGGFRGGGTPAGMPIRVQHWPDEWDYVMYSVVECPQCEKSEQVTRLIPHLNDDHKWTREEIALFVERLEKSLVTKKGEREARWVQERAELSLKLESLEDEILEAAEIT